MALSKKSILYKYACIALLLLILCLFGTACQAPRASDFSYTEAPFSLTVQGSITLSAPETNEPPLGKLRTETPLSFSATVSSDMITSSDGSLTHENALTVTYTAPESLKGLQVTCRYHPNMTGQESVTLSYSASPHSILLSMPYENVKYLLLPVTALFPQGDVTLVSPTDEGKKTVTLQSIEHPNLQLSYVFSKESVYPQSIVYESSDKKATLFVSAVSTEP